MHFKLPNTSLDKLPGMRMPPAASSYVKFLRNIVYYLSPIWTFLYIFHDLPLIFILIENILKMSISFSNYFP